MKKFFLFLIIVLSIVAAIVIKKKTSTKHPQSGLRLYWFIPDGMRADPDLFNVFRWAKRANSQYQKLMDRGSYGYSYPNFPSHTPTNFATL